MAAPALELDVDDPELLPVEEPVALVLAEEEDPVARMTVPEPDDALARADEFWPAMDDLIAD